MAGRIPQHFIDQLLNRVDVVDLIDGYVPLKKAGANYKACCPFHNEKSPSFTVSPSKQFYHCFGCGVNGTAISFLMDYDHMEFREAIEKLASAAGMEIPVEAQSYEAKITTSQGIDLYQLMSNVSDFYQTQLRQHKDKQQAVDYLKQRGLSGDIAKRFGLGFAPDGWDNLMSELGATVAGQKALVDTGMLSKNEKQRIYDRFRNRIMFPIEDHRGRVVGFGGRVLEQSDPQLGNPKYLNSPETPIFHKGSELYGLFAARGGIKEADGVLVVEGYMDVVALAQAGINNAVATLGTATTPMHLQRLFRHTHNIVFSFDGDRAGRAAAWKALETSLPILEDGYQLSFLFLPDGEDPDSMVNNIGKEAFEELIKNAMPLPDFLIDTLKQKADLDRLDGRAKLAKLAKPMIQSMPQGILRSLIIDHIAKLTQANPQEFSGKSKESKNQYKQRSDSQSFRKTPPSAVISPMRRAMSLILQYPHFAHEFSILNTIEDSQVRGAKTIKSFLTSCAESDAITTAGLLERYRGKDYFSTLLELANHQHNNKESMPDEEVLTLIRSNNEKIMMGIQPPKLQEASSELEALMAKSSVTTLSAEEEERKKQLKEFVRDSFK